MKQYLELGKKIYNTKNPKECRRMLVFILRAMSRNRQMKELMSFFSSTSLRQQLAATQPCVFEQPTRYFFYYRSTFQERMELVKGHFLLLEQSLSEEALQHVYLKEGLVLWEQQYKEESLSFQLHFQAGQRKEGLMALNFKLGERSIYQLIFWLGLDQKGQRTLWIGALQGMVGGLKTARDLTKHFFGYRPKNLILHVLRTFAAQLGLERIYAVSNKGFYANNHLRLDRKLKTSLDEFWQETGGRLSLDPRFFELPIAEYRKSIEEVVSHKRNLYRKRFTVIDGLDEIVIQVLKPYLKK